MELTNLYTISMKVSCLLHVQMIFLFILILLKSVSYLNNASTKCGIIAFLLLSCQKPKSIEEEPNWTKRTVIKNRQRFVQVEKWRLHLFSASLAALVFWFYVSNERTWCRFFMAASSFLLLFPWYFQQLFSVCCQFYILLIAANQKKAITPILKIILHIS